MINYEHSDLFYQDSIRKEWTIVAKKKEKEEDTELKVIATIKNEDILDGSIELQEAISSDDLVFGRCESSKFSFTVYNLSTSLKGATLEVSLSLNGNDPFKIGVYKVDTDKPTADRYHRKVVAYDALYEFNEKNIGDWYCGLTFPLTIKQFRDSLFTHLGMEQEPVTLVNDNIVLPQIYFTTNVLHCSNVPSTTRGGITYSISDGNIYINGTASITTEINLGTPILADGNYMVCFETERGRILNGHIKYSNGNTDCTPSENGTSFTSAGASVSKIIVPYGVTFENCTIHVWANKGTAAYPYVKFGDSGYKLEVTGNAVLSAICELNGAFGHITRENKFRYVILNEIVEGLYPNNDIIPKDDLYPKLEVVDTTIEKSQWIDVQYEDYRVQKIDGVVIMGGDNNVQSTSNPDAKNPLTIDDNFLLSELEDSVVDQIAKNLAPIVSRVWYIPATVKMIANPCVEVGDSIRFNTREAIIFTYVMNRAITGMQMLEDSIEATGEEKRETDKSITNQLNRISKRTKFDLEATNAKIDYLEVNYVKVNQLQAVQADVQRLTADNAVIRGSITAAELRVQGNIDAVNVDLSGKITAVDGKFKNIDATNITAGKLSVDRLEVGKIVTVNSIGNACVSPTQGTITIGTLRAGNLLLYNPANGQYRTAYTTQVTDNQGIVRNFMYLV